MMKAALAGYGWWGQHVRRRLADHRTIQLTGICAPELVGPTEAGLPVYPDFDAVLADDEVQAVILTTPNLLHVPQTKAAAAAGKHVYCEKPLSLESAGAREMVAACEAAGVTLAVGHERRFEPAMQRVAQMVEAGELGTIMHAESAFSHDKLAGLPKDNWRTTKAVAPAGGMTGMGIHLTDFYIWMFGPVETVQALTADRVLGWETGDLVTVQLGFKAGMTATLSAILATPHFIRYHVFGSDAHVEVRNDTHPDTPGGQSHLALTVTDKPLHTETYDWVDAVTLNLEAFAAAVEGKGTYPFTGRQLVHNIEVLEAIARSAETRETVRL